MVDTNLSQKPGLTSEEQQLQIRALMKKKNSLVTWIVSNCGYTHGAKLRKTMAANLESNGMWLIHWYCVMNVIVHAQLVIRVGYTLYYIFLSWQSFLVFVKSRIQKKNAFITKAPKWVFCTKYMSGRSL